MKYVLILLILGTLCSIAQSEVTVLKAIQTIYESTSQLRIRGSGFDANECDIFLALGSATHQLSGGMDYVITKDINGDGLVLKLIDNRR